MFTFFTTSLFSVYDKITFLFPKTIHYIFCPNCATNKKTILKYRQFNGLQIPNKKLDCFLVNV